MSDPIETLMTRNAELAAECERLKAVIANDTENEEAARAIAAEVFGKSWADGDSNGVPNVINFVERFRDELAAAQKTIAAMQGREGRLREACEAELQANQFTLDEYGKNGPQWTSRESGEEYYSASHVTVSAEEAIERLTAALTATDGGGE